MRLHLSSCRGCPAELRALYDLMIFVNVDDDTRLARRVRRDITERGRDVLQVLDQYERSVKPSFTQFILPTKQYAHIIVSASATHIMLGTPRRRSSSTCLHLEPRAVLCKHSALASGKKSCLPKNCTPPQQVLEGPSDGLDVVCEADDMLY